MRMFRAALIVVVPASLLTAAPADSKGCIRGAIAGGVAGHIAGHHALARAAAGCFAGPIYYTHKAKVAAAHKAPAHH